MLYLVGLSCFQCRVKHSFTHKDHARDTTTLKPLKTSSSQQRAVKTYFYKKKKSDTLKKQIKQKNRINKT